MNKKYLKENNEQLEQYLEQHQLTRFEILPDGKVNVHENVYVFKYHLTDEGHFMLNFNEVDGAFDCGNSHLSTMKGGPVKVGKNFRCTDDPQLTSWDYFPKEIGGNVKIYNTGITSLVGISDAIQKIKGSFEFDF